MGAALPLSDREWALQSVDTFPRSWQARLIDRWHRDRRGGGADWREKEARRASGNSRLLARVRTLADSARGGIRPDASDADICTQADLTARDFGRRIEQLRGLLERGEQYAALRARYGLRVVPLMLAGFCRRLLDARGLLDLWPAKKLKDRAGAIKRMACPRWWRRAFRKLHARTVEACAISLGLVRRTAGLYVSDDSVRRRAGQNARNAAALASVVAVNEYGQDYTLAELASKGTADKSIRRCELLTRIAGFELIAKDCGHIAYMVTVSCPSRFHATTTRQDGRVVDNPKHDGSTPDAAQRYLSKQWARCRAAAKRMGLEWYGFRIAEPQQDGTPHWHCLLFMPPAADGVDAAVLMPALVRRYFLLNDSPDEPGARKHRVDFEAIDWNRGSAVGYVIKYVSKNIDGHGVGLDLFGNDAITTSARVEAWAATWRVRQFQQIGGAPVGVWREVRRVHPEQLQQEGAPDPLREALVAVNVAKTEPGVAAIAWKRYTILQGGTGVRRDALRLKLLKDQTGEIGRYGDVMPARPVGVVAEGIEFFRNHIHAMLPGHPAFHRRTEWNVHSERAEWVIGQGSREQARALAARVFQRSGEAASTRIHVNNCTQPDSGCSAPEFTKRRRLLVKLRRYVRRDRPATDAEAVRLDFLRGQGGVSTEETHHGPAHRPPSGHRAEPARQV